MGLSIVLSNTSGVPIYEQIKQQLKAGILRGDLAEGQALPSIRGLARDLQVSVITTTRAYSDLAAEGFVTNVPGKGSYVLPRDSRLVREQVLREIEDAFAAGIRQARLGGVAADELHALLDAILESEES
ncbi:MAG: GntR family transcriptional regulator [Propionibacteriaceae bacterium]|nr:GntR family transcriptional regulator [Propionibacteriaceae bacterium]